MSKGFCDVAKREVSGYSRRPSQVEESKRTFEVERVGPVTKSVQTLLTEGETRRLRGKTRKERG